ncbi:adenosylcobinamide-GDP ribazoletransferase [Pseudodesulfovibrio cashew]|uniref:Adenosylcobinamide-GDP ribazoletransferase n=1 Tax=Pseudodesulfovibrio cashew TaxID=2678688 RepID=A0A6I6JD24_9BACT|nr:adenosylcobinamide-GDP ribazoletransferase [Pseudodesulfovibrio cashew]QGY40011.1 adenosylcobinamide-GDP ribazoletransferase [Pseudodesulfovibrio cashew]
MLRRYLNTLGFLTRLAPARIIPEAEMNRCMRYMPAVGLTLGAVIALPFFLGLFGSSPWTQAWLAVLFNILLTRGLHFDGLADVCDAVTTHADPERFWTVVKDSRAGAFGVLGLVMVCAGELVLFHEMLMRRDYTALIWAFVLGRGACVGFGYVTRHLARPGLGKLYIDGATLPVAIGAAGATFLLGLVMAGPGATVAAMFLATGALYWLHQLAERVGGVNGDFLGCAVMVGEVAAGVGFVLIG